MENLQLLNETIVLHMGLLQSSDGFTVNRNFGGINVRFFYSHSKYSLAVLYENDFWKLPKEFKWVADKAKEVGAKLEEERQSITEYEPAKKKGLIYQLPLVQILRFQRNKEEENEMWRFHAIYKVIGETKPKQDSEAPQKPTQNGHRENGHEGETHKFASPSDAAMWAVQEGAFQTKEQAMVGLKGVADRTKLTGELLMESWVNTVREVIKNKPKRGNN